MCRSPVAVGSGDRGRGRGFARRPNPSRLEKRFIWSSLAAIFAVSLISYVSLYTGNDNDDVPPSTNRAPLRPRNHALRRVPLAGVDGSTGYLHSGRARESAYHQEDTPENFDSIPSVFTAVDEQWLHNGRVVRELSRRVLSRNIAQSNVVVVSPTWKEAQVFAGNVQGDSTMRDLVEHFYPAKAAIEQGHTTHLLPTSTVFDEGWHTSLGHRYDSASAGWILLAYFSTQNLDQSVHHSASPTIDEILAPSRAREWLQQTTVTYLVFPISARATIPLSSIAGQNHEYDMDYTVDKTVEVTGLKAAKTLLDSNYKLQLLASSHYFDETNGGVEARHHGPNSLFMSVKSLHRFMYQQVTTALRKEVTNIGQHQRHRRSSSEKVLEVAFHSLIFATQGLDLAIPSRFSYTDVGKHDECIDSERGRKKRCDPKLNARALNQTILEKCLKHHDSINVQFVNEKDTSNIDVAGMPPNDENTDLIRTRRVSERTDLEKSYGVMIDLNGKWMKPADEETGEIEVWSGSEDSDLSEAVCARADKSAILPRVNCKTRIIPTTPKAVSTDSKYQLSDRPNLLVIMIDPLSKQQLRRSLPNTWAMLELLGFIEFRRYTAVGNNSGPNQAALYSGKPLSQGRQGIRTSNDSARTWIWDRLNDASYVTLKAEDGCISNSNMVQSIKPNTHHGDQLHQFFCQSFDRPNCLGGKLAAEHLVDYAEQFIDTYNRIDGKPSFHANPWAAFVSFVDSHEDSSTLISYLDGILLDFLQAIPMNNTLVLFTSDHGLHYGHALTTKSGEMERAQPILFMRMPSFQNQNIKRLRQNAQKFTTAYDVHETLVEVLLGKSDDTSMEENRLGMSLLKPLPKSRNRCTTTRAIPSDFCSLVDADSESSAQHQCNFMIDPPSIFSFYSDIPHNNRPQWPRHCPVSRDHSLDNTGTRCYCATNERAWFDCSNMPRNDFRSSRLNTEHFSLRSCSHHDLDLSLELDIHVSKNDGLVRERKDLLVQTVKHLTETHREDDITTSLDAQPNIIFLEIDSVSLSFSERYFPKTWQLLQHHSIVTDQDGISCPTGWCAGVFNKTSVVGQSSIVNQLAALAGCLQYDDKEQELKHLQHNDNTKLAQSYCPSGGKASLGVDEETGIPRDHWIFDVAKNMGYITFFGEEFCYEQSPYVVQTQSAFTTLDVDLSLSELYCELAKDWLKVNGKVNSGLATYAVEYDGQEVPDTCFDGKSRGEIGLEFIAQMWDAYSEQPKFAFLNALAAHDYNLKASHASLGAENYDITVHNFLKSIMARDDSKETYIFLRSDHGLQGGPFPIDYATQIEHMHPWTAIIAPANHGSLSIEPFSSNQNQLVTGFDLYHSIRHLMSPSPVEQENESLLVNAGIPPWSYNIFRQQVPSGRNCKDAKIPKEFCPCADERSDLMPSFYVGHSEQPRSLAMPVLRYDWVLRRFAAPRLPGLRSPKVTQSKYDVKFNRNVFSPRCNATLGTYIDEKMLRDSWQLIHNITSLYPGSDVSGGVFLYPRQSILLTYLVQREIASRASIRGESQPFRVCETGFGSGHSAALFLSAAPNVEVVSFDRYTRPYQTATFLALRGYYGKRMARVVGDSCKTVKKYSKECDFLHGSSLCNTDNIDLIQKSSAGATLTSTAMDSIRDGSVYFGEGAQWSELRGKDCIENIVCFQEEERTLDARLYLARGKASTISHKFCFSVNTGKCKKERSFGTARSSWRKDDFCPEWMIKDMDAEEQK